MLLKHRAKMGQMLYLPHSLYDLRDYGVRVIHDIEDMAGNAMRLPSHSSADLLHRVYSV